MRISNWAIANAIATVISGLALTAAVFFGSAHIEEKRRHLQSISRLAPQVFALRILIDEYLIEPSADIVAKWREQSDRLLRDIKSHRSSESEVDYLTHVVEADHARVQDFFTHWVTDFTNIQKHANRHSDYTARADNITRLMGAHFQSLLNDNQILRDFESAQILAEEKLLANLVLGITFLMIFFVLSNLFLIKRRIIDAVSLLQIGTTYIGKGDFDHPVNLGIDDEMGELSRAIEHMAQRLKRTTTSRDELERNIAERKRVENVMRDSEEALRRQQAALRETSQILKAVMDNTSSYIHVRDMDGRFVYVNDEYKKVFGVSGTQIVGSLIEEIFSNDVAAMRREMHETVKANQVELHAEVVETVQGNLRTYLDVKSPLFDESGRMYAVYCIGTDITDRKNLEASLAETAHYDLVTRLPNRALFLDRLSEAVKRSLRKKENLALLFLDLDAFKDVNDTLGHESGDVLLSAVGMRLQQAVRNSDTVARIGGDEFTIILEKIQSPEKIELMAQKILGALLLPFKIHDREIYVSASIGITVSPRDGQDTVNLMKNADQAMYASKRSGAGNYCFYTDAMKRESETRVRIIQDLKLAIRESQFHLLYQPIVSLTDGSIHKAEALIRWEHPVRGMINPSDFIPIAEATGNIIEIGEWVFHEASRQCADWRARIDEKFQISINTSPIQYRSPGIDTASWETYLLAIGLAGDAIVIEITEGLLMGADAAVLPQLKACSNLGMEIAIDDFGTGYSSLSYLRKFEVDYLKIDRTFVTNLEPNSNDLVLCEAIVAMAHKIGLKVIAEGVETKLQRMLLIAAGCDYGQGYLFSKPITAELFEQNLLH